MAHKLEPIICDGRDISEWNGFLCFGCKHAFKGGYRYTAAIGLRGNIDRYRWVPLCDDCGRREAESGEGW
jgi:hypothetical protein